VASSTGSRVRVTSVETSGISMLPKPTLRRNRTGTTARTARLTATVAALKTTARPALASARWTAASRSWPAARSSRQRVTTSSE
jgi:hypothetical protein